MNGLLSLKWNSHCTTVLKKLRAIYSQDVLCDVTIACQGKFYPVHKLVLSICSEYFEEIFKQTHCKHPFIIMRDIKPIELEALLSYMYNGEVNVTQEILPGLISAAESLKIIGLAISEDDEREKEEVINTKKRKFGNLKDSDSPENQTLHQFPDKILTPERIFPNSLSQYETNKRSRRESMEMIEEEERENYKEEVIKLEPKDSNETEEMNKMNDSCLSQTNSLESHSEAVEDNKISLASPIPLQIKEEIDQDFSMAQCSSWDNTLNNNTSNENALLGEVNENEENYQNISTPFVEYNHPYESPWPQSVEESSQTNDHIQSIISEGELKCPYCPYKPTRNYHLKVHIQRKHSVGKPFSCTCCDYKCSSWATLKIHHLKHNEKGKRHKCSFCSYETVHSTDMKRHIMSHTGEKPFACVQCSFRTTQKSMLKYHCERYH